MHRAAGHSTSLVQPSLPGMYVTRSAARTFTASVCPSPRTLMVVQLSCAPRAYQPGGRGGVPDYGTGPDQQLQPPATSSSQNRPASSSANADVSTGGGGLAFSGRVEYHSLCHWTDVYHTNATHTAQPSSVGMYMCASRPFCNPTFKCIS